MARVSYKSTKTSTNKKVKNAKGVEIDGIKFRSQLEGEMYKALKNFKVPFNYEAEKFTIQSGFKFRGETVRPITLLPDFTHSRYILECKGHETDSWKLKWKMFKKHLSDKGDARPIFLVYKAKDCASIALQILALYR